MGAQKSKLNKNILRQLETRTNRSPAEIKAMYAIFLRHFQTGRIESPQDLARCLKTFSLTPIESQDPKAIERLYRLFEAQNRNVRNDGTIDFFHFMVVSHILERGAPQQRINLYFQSLDVDGNNVITREDLEACLPSNVESQQLIQQLLQQWDMNGDGYVTLDDFEQYIMSNPDLFPMFVDPKDRIRMSSVTQPPPPPNEPRPTTAYANRRLFITSQ